MKIRHLFLISAPIILLGVALYLKTPVSKYSKSAIRDAAASYDTRVIRDNWGVAHIFGKTDADTSFGLGYTQAEDDWETLQEVLMTSRGISGQYHGFKEDQFGQKRLELDYLFDLFKVREAVDAKIETHVSSQIRAMSKAYADGINLWAAENASRVKPGILPVTEKEIIAGYTWATPFFFRMDEALQSIFEAGDEPPISPYQSSGLQQSLPEAVRGSYAFVIAPSRSEISGEFSPAFCRPLCMV